jgi:hypothetical protein
MRRLFFDQTRQRKHKIFINLLEATEAAAEATSDGTLPTAIIKHQNVNWVSDRSSWFNIGNLEIKSLHKRLNSVHWPSERASEKVTARTLKAKD